MTKMEIGLQLISFTYSEPSDLQRNTERQF